MKAVTVHNDIGALTNLDSILKSRGITFPTKVCLFKAMAFPAVMYGYNGLDYKET